MSIDNTRAAYRVLDPNGFYGPDDTLYLLDQNGDPAEIYFDGEPNEQLEPLNDLARERLNTHIEKLDALAKVAAEKLGRPFVGRPRNLDGALELASAVARDNMQIMGTRKEATSIERLAPSPTPETGGINPKRGRGRPKLIKISQAA